MTRLLPVALVIAALIGCSHHALEPEFDGVSSDPITEVDPDAPRTNPWVDTANQAVSTFSADVDTGSYSLTRRALVDGAVVDIDAVRTEEFLNYFRYDTEGPRDDLPFGVTMEVGPSTFGHAEDIQLLRIGVKAVEVPEEERDPVNLVFLIDVSGSMADSDKLPLVVWSLKQLVDRLQPTDTLGLVVYAGADRVVLEPTPVSDKSVILDALDALESGGSTNGEAGIRTAYDLAASAFREDGINRVVLASDGDMNVGLTGQALTDLVVEFRERDIFLTTLGVGIGNYQDGTMEQLADQGNGNYAYIDGKNEALRVLGENLTGTLQVVAKDVKLQVTFDQRVVQRWRLIGYENRLLDEDDFIDDEVDAGDIGAGHHVTALYELELLPGTTGELADLAIRYKEPAEDTSTEHHWTVVDSEMKSMEQTSDDFRFATGVAEFAEILRESPFSVGERFDDISALVEQARPAGARSTVQAELLELVDLARTAP